MMKAKFFLVSASPFLSCVLGSSAAGSNAPAFKTGAWKRQRLKLGGLDEMKPLTEQFCFTAAQLSPACLAIFLLPIAGCAFGQDYSPKSASEFGMPERYLDAADDIALKDISSWWAEFRHSPLIEPGERGLGDLENALIARTTADMRIAKLEKLEEAPRPE